MAASQILVTADLYSRLESLVISAQPSPQTMSQQRALWEADLDEELQDVDVNLAIGSYGQSGLYDDGILSSQFVS